MQRLFSRAVAGRAGYSIIELLVAVLLTSIVMLIVVQLFADVGEGVSDARASLETFDRVRAAKIRLQRDLEGVTVRPIPPRGETADGYLEIVEGPVMTMGVGARPWTVAQDDQGNPDTTVGDFDDILMFTARSPDEPFVGRYGTGTIESDVAEIAWFLRGKNLYRRVLLVRPDRGTFGNVVADVSARPISTNQLRANSLADLGRRENRYAHPWNGPSNVNGFPNDIRRWGAYRLPTANEAAQLGYNAAGQNPTPPTLSYPVDFWNDPPDFGPQIRKPGDPPLRPHDDLILTNVIGFDVKVFDPGAGGYVDLGYNPGAGTAFSHRGNPNSGLAASGDSNQWSSARIYDTWTLSYEADGVDQPTGSGMDLATNGFDDNGDGVIDDIGERETVPPYPAALRGIQVKIRVFEPDSRMVREVTVSQDFSQ